MKCRICGASYGPLSFDPPPPGETRKIQSNLCPKHQESDKPHEYSQQDTLWPPTEGIKFKYKVTPILTTPTTSYPTGEHLEKLLNDINKNDSLELYDIISNTNCIFIIHKEYERK